MEEGDRDGLLHKILCVYSLYASIISSNDSPEDSSDTGVDVASGWLPSGGDEEVRGGNVNEGELDKVLLMLSLT